MNEMMLQSGMLKKHAKAKKKGKSHNFYGIESQSQRAYNMFVSACGFICMAMMMLMFI